MGFDQTYFSIADGAPQSLSAEAVRRVRFEEVDMLRIAWHGHYVSYFDDGRVAFGDRYGLRYDAFRDAGFAAPIVQLHIDYRAPLRFDERMRIVAILHWSDALRLNFEYRIFGADDRLLTSGYTVQLLTDSRGETLFVPPPMIERFRQNWREGILE